MQATRLGIGIVLTGSVCSAAPVVYDGAVTDIDELAPFFEAAAIGRADVVGMGDSNQIFAGHGWDQGWIRALDLRFGTYATSLISPGDNNGNGSNAGYGFQGYSVSGAGAFFLSGAPAPLEATLPRGVMPPLGYVYVPEGSTVQVFNNGLRIEDGVIFNCAEEFRFSIIHGVFDSSAGTTFRPIVRKAVPGYNTVLQGPEDVPTTDLNYDVRRTTVDVPADAERQYDLQFMFRRFNQPQDGPFLIQYLRVERPQVTRGVAFGSFFAKGGDSARDMAQACFDFPHEAMTTYFGALREDQGATPHILIRINCGLNDQNEVVPPIGSIIPGDSAFAFELNLLKIIDEIQSVWMQNGWDPEGLFFCLTVSHPTGDANGVLEDDADLLGYRQAAIDVAEATPRCVAVDLSVITNEQELVQNNWYRVNDFDRFHLRENAYEILSERELGALQNGRSWYDANGDRAITPEDLYTAERWITPPADAPADLSPAGLRNAIRFGEQGDVLAPRD